MEIFWIQAAVFARDGFEVSRFGAQQKSIGFANMCVFTAKIDRENFQFVHRKLEKLKGPWVPRA